jgi:hypothetical protein
MFESIRPREINWEPNKKKLMENQVIISNNQKSLYIHGSKPIQIEDQYGDWLFAN